MATPVRVSTSRAAGTPIPKKNLHNGYIFLQDKSVKFCMKSGNLIVWVWVQIHSQKYEYKQVCKSVSIPMYLQGWWYHCTTWTRKIQKTWNKLDLSSRCKYPPFVFTKSPSKIWWHASIILTSLYTKQLKNNISFWRIRRANWISFTTFEMYHFKIDFWCNS